MRTTRWAVVAAVCAVAIVAGPVQAASRTHTAAAPQPDLLRLQGHDVDHVVVVALEDAAAAKLLPPGLELAPQTDTPPGTHPLLLDFGHFTRTAFYVHGIGQVPPADALHQLQVVVPGVQLKAKNLTCGADPRRGPFFYYTKIFFDSSALNSLLLSAVVWGYHFDLAGEVTTPLGDYWRNPLTNQRIAAVTLGPTSPSTPDSRARSEKILTDLFGLGSISNIGRQYIAADFTVDFRQYPQVSRPVTVEVTPRVSPAFTHETINVPGINETTSILGAFTTEYDWTVGQPRYCLPR